jgi:hypothetical protein
MSFSGGGRKSMVTPRFLVLDAVYFLHPDSARPAPEFVISVRRKVGLSRPCDEPGMNFEIAILASVFAKLAG